MRCLYWMEYPNDSILLLNEVGFLDFKSGQIEIPQFILHVDGLEG